MFVFVAFAWIFFRAQNYENLKSFMTILFNGGFHTTMTQLFAQLGPMTFLYCWLAVGLLAISYLTPPDCQFKSLQGKFFFTIACATAIVFLGMPSGGEFIYFQF